MTILAATTTEWAPTDGPGFFSFALAIGALLLAIATILMPFVIWSIMSTLSRMEKLHRQVAADIVNELRRM